MTSSERKTKRELDEKMERATKHVVEVINEIKAEVSHASIKMFCSFTAWGAGLNPDDLLRKVERRLL